MNDPNDKRSLKLPAEKTSEKIEEPFDPDNPSLMKTTQRVSRTNQMVKSNSDHRDNKILPVGCQAIRVP